MKKTTIIFFLSATLSYGFGQNLEGIHKQKPLVVHGSIGASGNYYSSNEPIATRPPWSWNLYGNFTPSVYGIVLPVSFVINQYGNSYTQPFGQFGISPTYKWAKLHVGYRTIQMSPMVFDGQSFRGVGLELNPKILRFAAFYGKLNRRVNEDTTSGRFSQPQFSRNGFGIKLGIGNDTRFFDLIYFHAKDDSTSANVISKNKIYSQENAVIGSSFKISFIKKITLTGDIALSGITSDLSAPKVDSVSFGFPEKFFSKLMPFHTSTVAAIGGQTAVNIVLKNYTSSIGYRRVQPGFKSLGTPYMLNDIELINWINNFQLIEGKFNINTSLSNQHNNLKKNLTSQLNTLVSTLNVYAQCSQQLNLNLNYSGYLLRQKDGTLALTDSSRLNQQVHQLNLSPSYTIFNTVHSHSLSAGINYMQLKDKNPVTAPFTGSNNISASLNYTLGFLNNGMNFTAGGIFNQYKQDKSKYSTYGVNLGSAAQFLKNKNLDVQATAGYMINQSSYANAQNNITFSGNVGYRIHKHSINFLANYVYTPYNPINELIIKATSQAVASKNFMSGISYNYSF